MRRKLCTMFIIIILKSGAVVLNIIIHELKFQNILGNSDICCLFPS